MSDANDRIVESTFERLTSHDWSAFGSLLSCDIERIGPFGERVVGRDAYVELMSQDSGDDTQRTTWDVHRVVYSQDRRSAFARVTAHVPRSGHELQIEQTLAYELDAKGLISRIEVFWRDPRGRPNRDRQ